MSNAGLDNWKQDNQEELFAALLEDLATKWHRYQQSGEPYDKADFDSTEQELRAMYLTALRGQQSGS